MMGGDVADRRQALLLLGTAGASQLISATPAPPDGRSRRVDVRQFGARGDGLADDTAAFNRATAAAAAWSSELARVIEVPAGVYRIDGAVYIRKGQQLRGDGHATLIDARQAKRSTFILGAGAAGDDPGGDPVAIASLRTLGGSDRHGLVYTRAAGFSIVGLFLSACGVGIEVEGTDGLISDIYIDQALNGVLLRRAQAITIANSQWYLANFALTLGSDTRAVTVTGCCFNFCRYAGLNLEDGSRNVAAITVSGSLFMLNEQYPTFLGFLHSRASDADLLFSGCTFRNWRGVAINQAGGDGLRLRFSGCVFDGSRASRDHNNSSTAALLQAGLNGDYRFVGCGFRELRGGLLLGSEDARASFADCAVERSDAPLIRMAGRPRITLRQVDGLADVRLAQGAGRIALPLWSGATLTLTLSGELAMPTGPVAFAGEWTLLSGGAPVLAARWITAGKGGTPPALAVASATRAEAVLRLSAAAAVTRLDARLATIG